MYGEPSTTENPLISVGSFCNKDVFNVVFGTIKIITSYLKGENICLNKFPGTKLY